MSGSALTTPAVSGAPPGNALTTPATQSTPASQSALGPVEVALPLQQTSPRPNTTSKKPKPANPLYAVQDWRTKMDQLTINVSPPEETTNEFTQKNNPDKRYWKMPVSFSCGQSSGFALRIAGVILGYKEGDNYGKEFVYAQIPRYVGEAIIAAGKAAGANVQLNTDAKIDCSNKVWWTAVTLLKHKVGVMSKHGTFYKSSANEMFTKFGTSLKCTADLEVAIKASTERGGELGSETSSYKLAVTFSHVFVKGADPEATEVPLKDAKSRKLVLVREDAVDDDFIRQMASFGLVTSEDLNIALAPVRN